MSSSPAGDASPSADPADLSDKPVLEWTAQDWALWARGASIAPSVVVAPSVVIEEPEPAFVEEPETSEPDPGEVAAWWASRPALPERPAHEVEVEAPVEVAPAPVVTRSRSGPAHRRRVAPTPAREHRGRAAGGLFGLSVLVGAVLASLITVALFVTTVVLQGLVN